jgi:hypothetical protein
MDIENRIRSRIEAILVNDARNYAEMKEMASDDEPMETGLLEQERNLYQRIISSYRSALSEVNALLEENVGFLSGLYKILESIKEKRSFEEICTIIVSCVLDDLNAEYGSVVFFHEGASEPESLSVEGLQESRRLLRIHTEANLLGSTQFRNVLAGILAGNAESFNVPDIYRDRRFNALDLPSVVRSLVCLPITHQGRASGALILSHSVPCFFNDNHLRVLKIVASTLTHIRLLTSDQKQESECYQPREDPDCSEGADEFSIVLLSCERKDSFGRTAFLGKETIRGLRRRLSEVLRENESILLHHDTEFLLVLPGTSAAALPARVVSLRRAFREWKASQKDQSRLSMSIGCSTCETGDDLYRTLEVAAVVMHPEPEEDPQPAE